MQTSRHYIKDIDFYKTLSINIFESFYGSIEQYCLLALLPSYLEREGSSLIYMIEAFIQKSAYPQSGFFLNEYAVLNKILKENKVQNIPTILWGVSFALLDFVEKYTIDFPELIIFETGGMKGRRKEMIREELHNDIKNGFNTQVVHSEYGMTELLSQAYSKGEGIFQPAHSMRVIARDVNDPLSILPPNGKLGVLNVIDLANFDTISFVATDDLGRVYADNSFEILGRLDSSDIRGCNLLV
jgi:hypothetical protein